MVIFIIGSKYQYQCCESLNLVSKIQNAGHEVILPNSYDNPFAEELARSRSDYPLWKRYKLLESIAKVEQADVLLVVNFSIPKGKNYIGGATFLEMFEGFRQNKKIYMINEISEYSPFKDELIGLNPIIDTELSFLYE